jgi:hypothetical protein
MVKRANKGRDMSDGTGLALVLIVGWLLIVAIAVSVGVSNNG